MKKKILVLALVAIMAVSLALTLTACGGPTVKIAHSLVHGNAYIGKAILIYNGDNLEHAYLDEAELPQALYQSEAISNVTIPGKRLYRGNPTDSNFFKTVKWGKHTATFNATIDSATGASVGYEIDGVHFLEFFKDEANCEEYFNAVLSDKVIVEKTDGSEYTLSGGVKPIGANEALKTRNDYWQGSASVALGWAENARQTCEFVMVHGFSASVDSFTLDGTWKSGDKVTGATWTDFKEYYALLVAASKK